MGCNTLVAFAGNQVIFTFESVTFEWQVALSGKRMACIFSFFIFALNMFNYSSIIAAVIQAFLLCLKITGNLLIFRFMKRLAFAVFQITIGFSISPTIFPHNNTVSSSLDILPPVHFSSLTASDFVDNAQKNNPVLPHCKCF
jgi:hypothetical protein